MRTCLQRFTGACRNCERDYSDHHPNNLDCDRYYEINISTLEARQQTDQD